MNLAPRLAVLAAAGLTAGLALAAPAAATPRPLHRADPGVVFVANDDVTGNAIAAYDRTLSGTLVPAGTYETGGLGGVTGARGPIARVRRPATCGGDAPRAGRSRAVARAAAPGRGRVRDRPC